MCGGLPLLRILCGLRRLSRLWRGTWPQPFCKPCSVTCHCQVCAGDRDTYHQTSGSRPARCCAEAACKCLPRRHYQTPGSRPTRCCAEAALVGRLTVVEGRPLPTERPGTCVLKSCARSVTSTNGSLAARTLVLERGLADSGRDAWRTMPYSGCDSRTMPYSMGCAARAAATAAVGPGCALVHRTE
jgi:hypothetical protein